MNLNNIYNQEQFIAKKYSRATARQGTTNPGAAPT
jgi:hypothetical protein